MNYFKSLFFNFLIVFFANHILPGIQVMHATKLPQVRSDLLFPILLGLLNSLIYPILRIFGQTVSVIRIASLALVINFISYAILKVLPIGIELVTLEGYLIVSFVVSVGSFVLNYLEKIHCEKQPPTVEDPGTAE